MSGEMSISSGVDSVAKRDIRGKLCRDLSVIPQGEKGVNEI